MELLKDFWIFRKTWESF